MKKLIIFALVAVVLYGIFIYRDEEILYTSVGQGEISFYTRYSAGEVRNAHVVPNGKGSIVTCDFADYKRVRAALNEISGVSIKFEGGYSDIETIIEKLEIKAVIAESLDEYGIVSYFGFTFKLRDRIFCDGSYVNVQIAKNGDVITVGYPIILGSY